MRRAHIDTVIVIGLLVIALVIIAGTFVGSIDAQIATIPLSVVSGLTGYLSRGSKQTRGPDDPD